jgi:integrase
MPLTDTAIRKAKPKEKPFKISDSGGLYLLVQPSGSKWWRYKYRFAGKEKLLALGSYPETSLAEAREKHFQAKKALAAGNDPGEAKRQAKRVATIQAENDFESIAREWLNQNSHKWSPHYAGEVLKRLKNHIFPKLGKRPIAELTAPDILDVLRVIEAAGALDMAQRMMQTCGQIFRYAITTGRADRNPAMDLRGALKTPVRKNHSYLKEDELPKYLKRLEAFDCSTQTKLALKFLLLTFVRTVELRGAEWSEINFDKAEWRIPAERMKMKELHIVPLSNQAVSILEDLRRHNGNGKYIFPHHHNPHKVMSENTILFALYRMGYQYKATGHGFRATASTILNEHGFDSDVIERQLAHNERNKVRAAYNHAQYLPERRKMMQWWANFLDKVAGKAASPE